MMTGTVVIPAASSAPGFFNEALNKSILDCSAPTIGKAWFSDGSQDQQLTAADLGSASLRRGKR
jgi:hypothetical protein